MSKRFRPSEAPEAGAVEAAVGHAFSDRSLLDRALTHASVSGVAGRDLEQLEFLGDRVLGLMAAETLWRRFPDMPEGEMAPRLNALVRKEACAEAARYFGLGPALYLSTGEDRAGGRDKDAILGDACEALLGALYIDGGFAAAKEAFRRYWDRHFEALLEGHRDAKTALQEWAQDKGHGTPRYVDVGRDGPDHAPVFAVCVEVHGLSPEKGDGTSKQAAQMMAAERLLRREGVWP